MIGRETVVVFRSAKERPFAERKATLRVGSPVLRGPNRTLIFHVNTVIFRISGQQALPLVEDEREDYVKDYVKD